jgi:hypothetical protein
MDNTFRKVEEHLRELLPPRKRAMPITAETELYRDLDMYGDVLAFDVVVWAEREFGVVGGSFCVTDYGPGECPFRGLWRFFGKLTGKKERQYNSLTVRDVVAAIETKRWSK